MVASAIVPPRTNAECAHWLPRSIRVDILVSVMVGVKLSLLYITCVVCDAPLTTTNATNDLCDEMIKMVP